MGDLEIGLPYALQEHHRHFPVAQGIQKTRLDVRDGIHRAEIGRDRNNGIAGRDHGQKTVGKAGQAGAVVFDDAHDPAPRPAQLVEMGEKPVGRGRVEIARGLVEQQHLGFDGQHVLHS